MKNDFKFPKLNFFDPKLAAEVTKTGQEMLKMMIESHQFPWFSHPLNLKPQYVEDKNLKNGDYVDFLDADGCFFCKATVVGVREDTALVQLDTIKEKALVVRRSDLLKLVPKEM